MSNPGDLNTPARWNAWANEQMQRARSAATLPAPPSGKRRMAKGAASWQDERRALKPQSQKKKINCLKHGGPFISEGPHNRICSRCKNSDDWQFGYLGGVQEGIAQPSQRRRET
ncbi:MAG: hypothetical protein JNM12_10020 [Alphaproteobacteria bacterium]|nr:hypothetical protein [Alphaproteobacteria bacterium]